MRIKVVRREDADSTLQVLRQSMPGWKNLAITEKSKTAVTTQDCIDTVKEVPGTIGFGPFTKALEMELSVLKIDGHHPTDRSYPSAVTLTFVHKDATLTPEAKQFITYAKTAQGEDRPDQHGRGSSRRVGTPHEDELCRGFHRSVPG